MLVYTFTQYNSWDGKEIMSVHLTKKGAMLDAVYNMCSELLDAVASRAYSLNKEEIEHIEKWYSKIDEKGISIAELEKALDYTSERYWHLEREVFIEEHTMKV